MMETGSFFRSLIVLLVIFSIVNLEVKSQTITTETATPCTTPTRKNGLCVPIEWCRNIYHIVTNPDPPSVGHAKYIQLAACTLPNVNRSICCVPEEIDKKKAQEEINKKKALVKLISGTGKLTAESATPCITPSNENGQCVPIERCQNIYNFVTNSTPPSAGNTRYINLATCTLPNVTRSICCQLGQVVKKQTLEKQISGPDYVTAESATPCMTPNKMQGQCVSIERCQNIHNIVSNPDPPEIGIANYIKQAACTLPNVNRSVCCQPEEVDKKQTLEKQIFRLANNVSVEIATSCTTPAKENGQCVPIERCRNINNIVSSPDLPEVRIANYIKQAGCTLPNVNRSICCQPKEVVKEQTPIKLTSRSGNAESATPRTITTKKPEKVTTEQTPMILSHPNINLLPEECGLSTSDRISKGNVTKVFDYPWMAVLQYNNGTHIVDACGGTLINKRYVLTAAHCINSKHTFRLIRVRLGEHTKNQEEDCNIYQDDYDEDYRDCADPPEDYEIESYVVHPNYNKPPYSNDIGLLRLKKVVAMNNHIKPICLPVTPELHTLQLKKFIVTGWGATEGSPGSEVLMEAILPRVDNVECQQKYAQSSRKVLLSDKQLCAGGEKKVDSCRGDSGGPLGFNALYYNRTAFVQFGVVSFGVASCGSVSVPGVYTRVSSYVDWILDNIKG